MNERPVITVEVVKRGALALVQQYIAAGIHERAELMEKTGLSSQQVGNAIRRLRDRGVLERGRGAGIPAPLVPGRVCLLAEVWSHRAEVSK